MAALNAAAPRITDRLCDACAEHFAGVRAHLDALGVPYRLEPGLVRGLDYYTRTAFEFYISGREGQQQALGGGGRYDGLVELLGGRPTPGIGFGVGLDRLLLALDEQGSGGAADAPPDGRRRRRRPGRHGRAPADRHGPAGGRRHGPRRARSAQARQAARVGGQGARPLRGHRRRRAGRRATSSSGTCRPAPRRSCRSPTSRARSPAPTRAPPRAGG